MGQEVNVSRGNGTVVLSVSAQKPYPLATGQEKLPVLSVECAHKGKKTGHTYLYFRLEVPWLETIRYKG